MSVPVHDPSKGLHENMTRRERREWYRRNKKELNLPEWGELQNLTIKPK